MGQTRGCSQKIFSRWIFFWPLLLLVNNLMKNTVIIYEHRSITSMLSNRTGIQQSIASTVMNIVINYAIQHFMQKGLVGNLMEERD